MRERVVPCEHQVVEGPEDPLLAGPLASLGRLDGVGVGLDGEGLEVELDAAPPLGDEPLQHRPHQLAVRAGEVGELDQRDGGVGLAVGRAELGEVELGAPWAVERGVVLHQRLLDLGLGQAAHGQAGRQPRHPLGVVAAAVLSQALGDGVRAAAVAELLLGDLGHRLLLGGAEAVERDARQQPLRRGRLGTGRLGRRGRGRGGPGGAAGEQEGERGDGDGGAHRCSLRRGGPMVSRVGERPQRASRPGGVAPGHRVA